jgi:prevent-host-death family protein
MQGARADEQAQPVRTVSIGELSAHTDEIVREVRATGRPVEIAVDGEVVAHLTPSPHRMTKMRSAHDGVVTSGG